MDQNFYHLKEEIEKETFDDPNPYFYYLGYIHGLSVADGISRQQKDELREILEERRKSA